MTKQYRKGENFKSMKEFNDASVIWKDIVGYEGEYQVSDTGLVRNIKSVNNWGKVKIQTLSKSGYYRVCLSSKNKRKTYRVNRLVAEAFLGSAPGMYCNHKDKDKVNNKIDNLEWVTPRENTIHGLVNTKPFANGCIKTNAKLSRGQVILIRDMYGYDKGRRERSFSNAWMAKCFKVSKSTIYRVISMETYHRGDILKQVNLDEWS